jgi:alpha-tubulin suppressor-like RCC1 family protein
LPQGHIVDVACVGLDPEQGCGVLALDDSGYVWAWGLDAYGELGSLHLSEPLNTPTKVYRIGVEALGLGAAVGCSLIVSNALGVEGSGCCANGTATFGDLPATTTFVPWGFPAGTAGRPVTAGAIFGGGNHLVVTSGNGGIYCSGTVPFPLASGTVPAVAGGLWRFRVNALRPALNI